MGKKLADQIEWSNPRLLCIASDYTKFDQYAVQQINRNIELIRYRRYSDDLIILELVNAVSADSGSISIAPSTSKQKYTTISDILKKAPQDLMDMYQGLGELLTSFGDDVQVKTLKFYVAFKRLRNFACVEMRIQSKCLLIYVNINPKSVMLEKGFTRDVTRIGHFGTNHLEITLRTMDDIDKARSLLEKSYEQS